MTETTLGSSLIYMINDSDNSWKSLEDKKDFIDFINPLDDVMLTPNATEVLVKDLPFYKNAKLLRIGDSVETEDSGYSYFIKYDGQYARLRGDSSVIHEVNDTIGVDLNENNVFDYLKFFNLFTADEEGNVFYIIEGEESEFLSNLSPYEKQRALRKFNGSKVYPVDNLGNFCIDTRVLCDGYLYDVSYEIKPDGNVEMTEDISVGSF